MVAERTRFGCTTRRVVTRIKIQNNPPPKIVGEFVNLTILVFEGEVRGVGVWFQHRCELSSVV